MQTEAATATVEVEYVPALHSEQESAATAPMPVK